MAYPINENEFVDICMKELGDHDEVDEKIARAIVIALNWTYNKEEAGNMRSYCTYQQNNNS